MQKLKLNANPVGANCIRPNFKEMTLRKEKGITLIALIITIIVMLILVGVTINVALNGGLFEKGEKAAFQTEVSTVKEQLEIAKVLKVMNAKGESVNDYSDIVVANLEGLDENTKTKYASILVVNKNGDICYDPANVSAELKVWLEEIGINAYLDTGVDNPEGGEDKPGENEPPTQTLYSFTLNELGDCYVGSDSLIYFNPSNVWGIVGENLAQNNNYCINTGINLGEFSVMTDSKIFKDYNQIEYGGDSIDENTQFIVLCALLDNDEFIFGVYTAEMEEVLEKSPSKPIDFLEKYGDIEFRFTDISSLEIP